MPDESLQPIRLTEAQFREVIERAGRDDADGIPLETARTIALELGLDPRAVDRALHDVVATAPAPRRRTRGVLSRIIRRIDTFIPRDGLAFILAAAGGLLGWFSASIARGGGGSNAGTDVPVFFILATITLLVSLSRRHGRRFTEYLTEISALWAAFAAVWSGVYGRNTDDLIMGTLVALGVATVWGWLVVRGRDDAADRPEISGEVTPVPM